jgi:chitinase
MYNKVRVLTVICVLLGLLFVVPLANAAPVHADRGAWAAGVAYAVNDTVSYSGSVYKCLQAHTSQADWMPPAVPALWQLVGSAGATATNIPAQPTATRTNTSVPATATRTNTPTIVATRTASPSATLTSVGATTTRTNTPTASTTLTSLPSSTATKTATPSGASGCATPWNATSVYVNGNIASDNGHNYKAGWWNQNDRPSTSTSGAWTDQGVCVPPTAGPTPQSGNGLPGTVFAPYADISFTSVLTANQATAQKYYALAFVLGNAGTCTPAWDGTHLMPENYYSSEINSIRSAGGDVIGVFGGASGSDIASVCTTVSSLQGAYQAVVTQYKFKWIDLNIEGNMVADSASLDRRNKAIAALEAANPGLKVSYTLPVLQSGLLQTALDLLSNAKANGVRIDYVNIMTMNYGPSGVDMGQGAINAATNTYSQLTSLGITAKIGITPMNGQNNTGGEIFTLANADALIAFAKANGYVGWLSFWSLGRDNGSCAGNTTASASCSGISQNNYDFTKKFEAYP